MQLPGHDEVDVGTPLSAIPFMDDQACSGDRVGWGQSRRRALTCHLVYLSWTTRGLARNLRLDRSRLLHEFADRVGLGESIRLTNWNPRPYHRTASAWNAAASSPDPRTVPRCYGRSAAGSQCLLRRHCDWHSIKCSRCPRREGTDEDCVAVDIVNLRTRTRNQFRRIQTGRPPCPDW